MEEKTTDYIIPELDTDSINAFRAANADSTYHENVVPEDYSLGVCWGIKFLEICVISASSKKVVLEIRAGRLIRLAKITLTPASACAKFKENLGGDFLRLELTVCADFGQQEIRANGRICASFACTKFNQRLLKW